MPDKTLLSRFYEEVFWHGDFERADEILAPDFVWRRHSLPLEPSAGSAGVKQFARALHGAFPDLDFRAEAPLGENDRIVTRWSFRGHQGGPWLGFAPTNHPVFVTGVHIARLQNGRIAELWQNWGLMSLMQQLGLLPIIGEQTVYPEWEYPEPGSVREPLPAYQSHIERLAREDA